MNTPAALHAMGQSLWLDNITREMLDDGSLKRYIDTLSVTGLTSNPSIFDNAIGNTAAYDEAIRAKAKAGLSGESLFNELALEDLRRAADLFRPIYDATQGVDGWVSMEVSPLLAADTQGTLAAAKLIHDQAMRVNLFVKIPGTPEGVPAIEEAIFAGVPVNVTLLFSREHYLAVAEAYLRGLERRQAAGLSLDVASVASLFISRWDAAVAGKVPERLLNKLGIAMGARTYRAYRELLRSERWKKLEAAGAKPQRLLWASTGTKDPNASPILYIETLAVADTVNTIPEKTLLSLAAHTGELNPEMATASAAGETVLSAYEAAGVNIGALAERLQKEGAEAFVKSWKQLLQRIEQKSEALTSA